MSYCLNPDCQHPQNPEHHQFCQNCGWNLRLANRYRALKMIGQGGFGRTFLAHDESQSPPLLCVIKQAIYRFRNAAPYEESVTLFQQEAERLAELGDHPQIPALLDYIEEHGCQYLVQEFIGGQTLEQMMAKNGAFSEAQIRQVLEQVLPVLQYIHDHKVIHRDVKPENLIVKDDGTLVLVDFGAAKFISETAPARTGTVIGSAAYVSPEQAMGKAEFSSDFYSLGVACLHLLTGLHPFDLYSASEDSWIWRQYLPTPVSVRLRRVLSKLVQRATSLRYQSADEVLQDLKPFELSTVAIAKRGHRLQQRMTQGSASGSTTIQQWRSLYSLSGHTGAITALAVHPDGRLLASGSRDRSIRLWDLETGTLLHTFSGRSLWLGNGHQSDITTLTFFPDGKTLISGSEDGTLKFWDVEVDELIATLPGNGWGIRAIALSADGFVLASGGGDGTINIWDLDTLELQQTLTHHRDSITDLALSPKGHTLISSSQDCSLRVWDVQQGRPLVVIKEKSDCIQAIAPLPAKKQLLTGSSSGILKLWNLTFQSPVKAQVAHRDRITGIAISPKRDSFATASEDSTIRFWSLPDAEPIQTRDRHLLILHHDWAVEALCFNPQGNLLISAGADELINVWQRPHSSPP